MRGAKTHFYNTKLAQNKNNITGIWKTINCILSKSKAKKQLLDELRLMIDPVSDPDVIGIKL